jgi:hypothetical protein
MRFFACFPSVSRIPIAFPFLIAGQLLTACGDDTSGPAPDPNAQLVLLEPHGGEIYHVGDSLHVRWKARGKGLDEISSVTVSLSPDSGATWASLKSGSIAVEDAQWGDFGWKIPSQVMLKGVATALAGRTKILVRVQDYVDVSDPEKAAITPESISIQP